MQVCCCSQCFLSLVAVIFLSQRFSKTDDAVPYQRMEDMFYHLPQVQCYLEMTDADYCDLMSYTRRGSNVFRIARDPQLFFLLRASLERFRACVEKQVPPPDPQQDLLAKQIREMCMQCPWTLPPQLQMDDDFFS